nr:DUF465 domain-containing protein [Pseudomonas sp.]
MPLSPESLRHRLVVVQEEHRDLDAAIALLARDKVSDQLRVTRLKKRKLQLKDEAVRLQMMLVPDIHA